MVYTYYVPLPKTFLLENLGEILDSQKAAPLLRMLMSSESSSVMKDKFASVLSGKEPGVLPMMASSLSAQNVGFFAYKPGTSKIHEGLEASEYLHLATLRTKSLLGGAAPHQHPLGPIWVETTQYIISMLEKKEASLTLEDYQMTVTSTGKYILQQSFIARNEAEKHANRKRKLEEENMDLGRVIAKNKAEIRDLEALLSAAEKKPSLPVPSASTSGLTKTSEPEPLPDTNAAEP